MANSLLAHLYSHIKGSQEDIATISLQYILSQSKELRMAFTKRMSDVLHTDLSDNLQYHCQQTGKNKERPDMAGINMYGTEELLCEMKFYAGLTTNQPNTYLQRLIENNGKGLVFICPESRKITLWHKLKNLCKYKDMKEIDDWCVSINDVNMAIITWDDVLYLLETVASSVAVNYLSDIQQLKGYCKQMDSDELLPFDADDLTAEVAKKAERYYRVLDIVIDLLKADNRITTATEGLKATANRNGYSRSIYIENFAVTINYDREMWKRAGSIETPFWVSVRNKEWKETEEIMNVLNSIDERFKDKTWYATFVALEPLMNATMQEVAEDLKKQVLSYLIKFINTENKLI